MEVDLRTWTALEALATNQVQQPAKQHIACANTFRSSI
jgi:hypothetical protein